MGRGGTAAEQSSGRYERSTRIAKAIVLSLAMLLALGEGYARAENLSEAEELALQPDTTWKGWLALLHYRRLEGEPSGDGDDDRRWRSEIASPTFFLDPEGRDDPEREWSAARLAFLRSPRSGEDTSSHARCRFPARFAFMKAQLRWRDEELVPVTCRELAAFEQKLGARSLAVVFASYFISNPASTFGHTMLYVGSDPSIEPGKIQLADSSIGFEADTKGLSPAGYIPKGLAGGLSAGFRVKPFYELVRKYERQELRDLWLFPLRLRSEELAQLVRHTWELRFVSYQYGFFGENCAQKILTLVHAVAPHYGLLPFPRAAVLPAEVVRRLVDKLGLHQTPILRRSLLGRYEQARGQLSAEQRLQLDQLIRARDVPQGTDVKVLAAALLWSELQLPHRTFRRAAEVGKAAEGSGSAELRWRRALLEARERRDSERGAAAVDEAWQMRDQRSLLDGHAPSRLALRSGRRQGESVAEVGVRWLLHDPLDPPVGYPARSTLEVLHLDAGVSAKGAFFVNEATALRLEKLGRSSSLQSPLVWKLELGARRLPTGDETELHAGAEVSGGVGWAAERGEHVEIATYALLGLRPGAQLGGDDGVRFAPLGLGAAGMIVRLGPVRARIQAEAIASFRDRTLGHMLSGTARVSLTRSWDAELAGVLASQGERTATLGFVLFR